jgi:endoplasmic reticulum junction formation protein lunapark
VVQIWYARKGDAEGMIRFGIRGTYHSSPSTEKTLRELRKKQHTKLEEIKKKTDYYATRDLLQKYDETTPANSPLRGPPSTAQNTPINQNKPGSLPPNKQTTPLSASQGPMRPQQHTQRSCPTVLPDIRTDAVFNLV